MESAPTNSTVEAGAPGYTLEEMLTPPALAAGDAASDEWEETNDYVTENRVRQIILAVTKQIDLARSRQSDEKGDPVAP
jgi:hypothetical protein